jgi:DNA-binding beta-propeller fold protein YncE
VSHNNLPSLEVLTMMNDHFGNFYKPAANGKPATGNVGGLTNATLEMASNDHAVGLLVDAVSHSKYWKDTAIFIAEDDSQDGPDHVDAHRSTGYAISAYSRPGVIHTFYNHPAMVRTIEDILGTDYLGMNDANAYSMDDAFEPYPNYQPYDAIIPGVLCRPPVKPDLVPACDSPLAKKTRAVPMARSTKWWIAHGKKLVFSAPDTGNADDMNRIIWAGTVGDVPYPEVRTGEDLSLNRAAVLHTLKVPAPL